MEFRREPVPCGKGLGMQLSGVVHGGHGIVQPFRWQAWRVRTGWGARVNYVSRCNAFQNPQLRFEQRMKVYFACSLTGGRADEGVYAVIVDHLLERGMDVPTAHLSRPEVMALERVVDPQEVYQRDIAWIEACDVMVAEVSTPSHGVGYELAFALSLKKPVLACFREGAIVSKMITGNNQETLRILAYPDTAILLGDIDTFLGAVTNQ